MKEQHYIQIVHGGTDPLLIGPFDTTDEQMVKAREYFVSDEFHEDYDGIFGIDTDSNGKLSVWSFSQDTTDQWAEEHREQVKG